ncbi:MAG: RHS repeat-associated core domain-containing protein [Actinomycetota bacterium]
MLVAVPIGSSADVPEVEPNEGIDVLPPDPPSEPVPDLLREPVPAETTEDAPALKPDELVEEDETIQEAIEDATLDKQAGGENFDVYTVNGAEHFATVYPWPVNYEATNGEWKDLSSQLAESVDGWTGEADGSVITFPAQLDADQGIDYAIPEGTIRIAPVLADATKGERIDQSVRYASAAPGTDYTYTLAPEGYKEEIIWRSEEAKPALEWTLVSEELTFAMTDAGEVSVLGVDGSEVATLSAPIIRDASPEREETVAVYSLTDTGNGSWSLAAAVDPTFLADAVYPVTVDPQPQSGERPAERDTFVSQGNGGTSFESDELLRVSGNSGSEKRSYLRFDISGIQRDDRLVYAAALYLYKDQINNSGDIAARRVDDNQGWPTTMTWNNKPALGMQIDGAQEQDGPWRFWELENLYQHYIQTGYSNHWPDQGLALEAAGGSIDFLSKENTEFANNTADPRLYLEWNDLSNAPQSLTAPGQDAVVETPSPTLKIGDVPNDFNGDKVLVRFQIDENSDWNGDAIKYTSPWQKEERSHVVPGGVLTDGQTYYWRAQAKDPFPLTDGSDIQRTPATSQETRHFSVALRHYGEDDRWAMWSRALGNGMNMKVNEANGNLFLDVPIDTVSTPLDDVEIALAYNSLLRDRHAANDTEYGYTPGWDLSVGPASAGGQLPIELEKIPPQPDGGVKIRMRDGALSYFPHRDGRVYAAAGSPGEVRKDMHGNFVYKDEHGGRFFFSSDGKLQDAAPAWTKGAAENAHLHYTYNTDGRLTKVTDPIDREIRFFWNTNATPHLDRIKLWDGIDNRIWNFTYSDARLQSIQTPVTQPGTSQRETITFSYSTAGRLIEVQDGEQTAHTEADWDGWKIKYGPDALAVYRVDRITPPGGVEPDPLNPAADGDFWDFDYPTEASDYRGSTAGWTKVIDPRGIPNGTSYLTTIDFNWAGLPIRIEGPAGADSYRPQTTMVWDSNNNMICKRSPAANAVSVAQLPSKETTAEDHVCKLDVLNTVYEYETQEPHRMTKIRHPVPADGGVEADRQVETFSYDQGASFAGLWAELYGNQHLEGFPTTERMWTEFDKNWGDGSPTGIGGGNDWSLRMTGYLDLRDETAAKDYEFKVFSDDGIAVTIGDKSIVNCFGETNDYNEVNCDGRQIVEKTLFPGLKPITIEFSELAGNARFTIKWDKGLDDGANDPANFVQLNSNHVRANLGLMTSKTASVASGMTKQMTYDYASDDAKARELMISETVSHLEGTDSRTTSYEYNNYGQVTKVTSPSSVTTNTYTNGTSPGTWIEEPGVKTSCMRSTVVTPDATDQQVLSEITRECDAAGNVRREVTRIDDIEQQEGDDRISTTTYDALGRVVTVNAGSPSSAVEKQLAYDLSGRTLNESVLLDAAPSPDRRALTEFEYFPTGNLKVERQPDPGTGGLRPTIHYTYDYADNQLTRTDPRHSGWLWETTFDASNRAIEVESPLGLKTSTEYFLVNAQDAYDHKTVTTSPNDVSSTTSFDVLGRKTKEQSGTNNPSTQLRPTTYLYDLAGNVTESRSDRGTLGNGPSDVVTQTEYNVFGQVEKTTNFATAPVGDRAVTDNHYNAKGQLDWVDGPRTEVNDKMLYDYDALGRLTKATSDGVSIPGSSTKLYTQVKYNMAGERVWMKSPLTSTSDMVRDWAYDEFGRLATSIEHPDVAGRPDRISEFTYNDSGWLVGQETHESGQSPERTLSFAYDDLGRMTQRSASPTDPTNVTENYTFDTLYGAGPGGTKNTSVNAVATITQWIDKDGRVWKVSAGGQVTETTFDAGGQVSSIADAAGTTTFAYDPNTGLLDKLYDPLTCTGPIGGCTPVDYSYDAAGRVTGRSDPAAIGGLQWTRGYETATGRTDSQTIVSGSATLVSSALTYDPASNVIAKDQQIRDATNNTDNTTGMLDDDYDYTYDAANRLASADGPGQARSFTYDGMGNRLSVTVGSSSETFAYDDSGQPRSSDEGTPSNTSDDTTFDVDVYGNLTNITRAQGSTDDSWEFRYDSWGRMYEAEGPSLVEYAVDPLNRVRTRTEAGVDRTYSYRGVTEDPASVVEGSSSTTYSYSAGGPMAQKVGSTVQAYVRDLHDDVVGMVNASGIIQGTRTVRPFGEQRQATGVAKAPFGFQGDLTDEDTDLVDMLSRYYIPELGRFSTRDAIFGDVTNPISLNQFGYAHANPASNSDPTGMLCSGPDPFASNCNAWQPPSPNGGRGGSGGGSGTDSGGDGDSESPAVYREPAPTAAPVTSYSPRVYILLSIFAPLMAITGEVGPLPPPGFGDFPIPNGARGPVPTRGDGVMYTGGRGGPGLSDDVTSVRFMNKSSKYPNGYVNYGKDDPNTGKWQTVNPRTGKPISKRDPLWHLQGRFPADSPEPDEPDPPSDESGGGGGYLCACGDPAEMPVGPIFAPGGGGYVPVPRLVPILVPAPVIL